MEEGLPTRIVPEALVVQLRREVPVVRHKGASNRTHREGLPVRYIN